MKIKLFFIIIFCFIGFPLFAQSNIARIAPGAESQLAVLLNRPTLIKPAVAVPIGRNWFTLELDAHVFSDQVSVNQVRAALLDFENHDKIFDGDRNKRRLNILSRDANEITADYTSITPAPMGIQIRTTYRVTMKIVENTDTRFVFEIHQTPQDSETNRDIRNHSAVRYAQEVVIDGKTYTYIRIYSINDVNGSILPNARNTFERNAAPANEETMQLIINAAKSR